MRLYPFTTLVAAVFVFTIAVITFRKGKQRSSTRLFAWFCVTVAWWCFADLLVNLSANSSAALLMTQILHVGAVFAPTLFLHFLMRLTNSRNTFQIQLAYTLSGFCLLCDIGSPLFVSGVVADPVRGFSSSSGPLYNVFLALFAYGALYGLYRLIRTLRTVEGAKKTQLAYVLVALNFVVVGGILYFLLTLAAPLGVPPADNLFVIMFTSIITYAVLKHRLMDINLVITRTASFMLSYVLALGLPLFLLTSYRYKLEPFLEPYSWVWIWISAAFLGAVAHYANLYLQRKTEQRFLSEQSRYRTTLKQASQGMMQIRDLDKLLQLIVRVVTKSVQLTHGAAFLRLLHDDKFLVKVSRNRERIPAGMALSSDHPLVVLLQESEGSLVTEELDLMLSQTSEVILDLPGKALQFLKEHDIALVIPSLSGGQLIGFLALGPKRSGRSFSQDDINVFTVLANQAALAVENALFFEELKTTQAQLFHSEKLATMGQLASSMAHEIHNPLAVISGEAQLLLVGGQMYDAQTVEFLNDIVKQCKRAEEITDRLLNFSRAPKDAKPVPLDVNEIVTDSLKLVEHQVKMESVELVRRLVDGLPVILGNRTQIQEIFLNLALNACQAMKEQEGARLEVVSSRNGKFVEVTFRDNGPGISRENIRRIFDPFFTTKSTGTGLGLFICDRIIREHQGKIMVESEIGKGTTFTVRLPIAEKQTSGLG